MSDTTLDIDTADEAVPSSYTSETPAAKSGAGRGGNVAKAGAVGRRKEAVARVRIVPGTGRWTINGRELDNYFPNKVHQQLVNEPFKTLDLEGRFDVIARIAGGGIRTFDDVREYGWAGADACSIGSEVWLKRLWSMPFAPLHAIHIRRLIRQVSAWTPVRAVSAAGRIEEGA